MSPPRTQPALLGGLVIGVLSALPVVNLANCCCAWVLLGGAMAAYLMQQNHPEPIGAGDGALVGLGAGVFGAVVWVAVSLPVSLAMAPLQTGVMQRLLSNSGDFPPEARSLFESLANGSSIGIGLVFGFFVMLFVGALFGLLGGLFGALLFRKAPVNTPPPPSGPSYTPPSFTPPALPGPDR